MVLKRFGTELTQQEIAKELEIDMVVGTSAKELEKFFKQRGFVIDRKNNAEWGDLAEALGRGVVIVGYLEREGDPHYALVRTVGEAEIVLIDPWHGDNLEIPKVEFEERWKDNEIGQYGERMLMTVATPAHT
ncbi:hypothetical protein A3F55_02950 [Candidatus Adlerbacteria bacterium RIFCSPHIGHO2_12_FULL_53_18]|uniref:Peptidase C39 domain-containing protein n=1 Tax=Candidatus Adlerbacteria bacterium RIFCSPHIGHO2_12_FULL_53_18 TaxID=1797242 RepID=A0A1F4XTC2_9BACT|nr:MAG: hypothetical protein A3F55_02950 [Candidatus Adlerbacteria bacterium RIFCSPHIGHO2_12_FULL_53_18]